MFLKGSNLCKRSRQFR